MTAKAGFVARGLLRRLGSCSPLLAGMVTGSGCVIGLYALHACIEGQLDAIPHLSVLPEVDGCHCWLIGFAGFFVGALCALAIAVIRRLLEPLVALLCDSLLAVRSAAATPRRITFAWAPSSAAIRQPLARRLASRAPPLHL